MKLYPETGKVAVKMIYNYGDQVAKVFEMRKLYIIFDDVEWNELPIE